MRNVDWLLAGSGWNGYITMQDQQYIKFKSIMVLRHSKTELSISNSARSISLWPHYFKKILGNNGRGRVCPSTCLVGV